MVDKSHEQLDVKIREAFPVDEAVASRLAGRALALPRGGRVRRPLLRSFNVRSPLALAAIVLCAALAAWLSRPVRVAPPAPAGADVIRLSGSFVDGVLIVPIPGDGVVVASPERRDRPREGSGLVVVEGEGR